MEKRVFSLCPACTACPEVVIDGGQLRIGEAENMVILQKAEWNVLVEAIRAGQPGPV